MKNPQIIKFTKIIILNIFFVFLVLFVADYFTYLKFKNDYIKSYEDILEFYPPIKYFDKYKSEFSPNTLLFQNGKNNNLDYFRPVSGEEYKDKNSILIFGCSFAYSHLLEDNQTISEKLSQFTKRTVYNFGMSACGIQHMYKLLELGGGSKKLFEKIKNPPDNIIYIYIPSHMQRLKSNIFPDVLGNNGRNLQYKIENNKLKENFSPIDIFSKTFLISAFYYQKDLSMDFYDSKIKDENSELAFKLFSESKRILQEKYPNIKFTILRYEVTDEIEEEMENSEIWNKLEQNGFIIINSSDLIGRKFKYESEDTNQDGYHPSEYAWDLLIPPLVKELNL